MLTFFDDELHNLILVADKNIKEIIAYTSNYDYHPPLQYILNKIFLSVFGLNEFWLSAPSLIFIVISLILCGKLVFTITGSSKYSIFCGFIIAVNPLVLLWGSSIRWYPFWTFLIILSFYLFIKLWGSKKKNLLLSSSLVLVLTLALYTNYLTIPCLLSALATAILLDVKQKAWIRTKQTGLIIAGVFILFIPYLPTFIPHLENYFMRKNIYEGFTGTSPLIAGEYYIFSVFFGQSIFPWSAAFIILFSIGLISLIVGLVYVFKNKNESGHGDFNLSASKDSTNTAIINFELYRLLLLFFLCLLIVFLISSIVSRTIVNRGILFLPMLLVIVIGCYWFYIYKIYRTKKGIRKIFFSLTAALVAFLLIWLIGSYNVFNRQHLHKSGMEIPVKEITGIIKTIEKENGDKLSVITTDFVLTYYLLKVTPVNILSPYSKELEKLPGIKNLSNTGNHARIIFIKSYLGALMPLKEELDNYSNYLFTSGSLVNKPIKLGYDPDYKMKKRFFPFSGIEEWRYRIYVLSTKDYWDLVYLKKIESFKVY